MTEEILNKLIDRCAYLWGCDAADLSADTTFAEHNTKSVQISQMTTYLEDEYDCEVPYMQFKRCKTLGEAAEFVSELVDE